MTIQQERGSRSEQKAQDYLEAQGLILVDKNYKIKRSELDLIMRDQKTLVFVEVRYRQNPDHGSAIESVTPYKQRCIIRGALHYLQKESLLDEVDCRFDVVGIDANEKITWIKDAFQVQY